MEWAKLLSTRRVHRSKHPGVTSAEDWRTEYERDADAITFNAAFRRLQDKTQVFPLPADDSVHSRLTHSLEVASVGRSLGRAIGHALHSSGDLDEKNATHLGWVTQAACLAHDIGNPPFGHAGEDAIQEFFKDERTVERLQAEISKNALADLQTFDGNAQGFRLVTKLQHKSGGGMHLTAATMGAFMKYPRTSMGSFDIARIAQKKSGIFASELKNFADIAAELGLPNYVVAGGSGWERHPLAYVVEAADDICYGVLDLEDAIRIGLVEFGIAQEVLERFARKSSEFNEARYIQLDELPDKLGYLRTRIIGVLLRDCQAVFQSDLHSILEGKRSAALVDSSPHDVEYRALRDFVKTRCYHHPSVLAAETAGYAAIRNLLSTLVPIALMPDVRSGHTGRIARFIGAERRFSKDKGAEDRVRSAVDFVAGMTDRYALNLHRTLTGVGLPAKFHA
jgi:dGTPase